MHALASSFVIGTMDAARGGLPRRAFAAYSRSRVSRARDKRRVNDADPHARARSN